MNYYDLSDEAFEALLAQQIEATDYSTDIFEDTEEMLIELLD